MGSQVIDDGTERQYGRRQFLAGVGGAVALGSGIGAAAGRSRQGSPVTVRLDNVGASAWELAGVDDDRVGEVGAGNPTLTLTVGTRYRFVNDGESGHPLEFRDGNGRALLSQSIDGAFEDRDGVDWVADDGSYEYAFTLTQELADALDSYWCRLHRSMNGGIETVQQSAPAAVEFRDQSTLGTSVTVDSVRMDDGGFLTIHDSRLLDGQPLESVRGVSEYLGPGVYEDVEVALDDPLTEDETLIAMPHRDDPADEAYTFVDSGGEEDPPYTADGDAVVDDADVQVDGDAAVLMSDQESSGERVAIDFLRMDDGGFLTIHDSRLLDGQPLESVRGVSEYLGPDVYEDVEVTLDDPLTEDETLIAMPHRDDPADEAYTFVDSGGEEDSPYTDRAGDALVDTAEVTVTPGTDTPDVTVSLDNVGASAWELTGADSGVAPAGTENPTLRLRTGTRYTVENGGWSGHPLAFRDENDEPLVTQSGDGRFGDDPGVDWADDGSELAFTVTDEFAAAVDDYVCTIHPSMEGSIEILPADAPAAEATIDDQESDGESVVVASVRMDDGGFLTIHDSRLLDGQPLESVRGVSEYLGPGVYEDVEVALDDPLTEDETLIAMPHRDDPADEAYTFVDSGGEEDPPYLDAEGNAVVDDASVSAPAGDTPTETQTPTETATPTETRMATETADDTPTETDDDSGPGFGPVAGAAGVGSLAAYALRKLSLRGDPPTPEDDTLDDEPTGDETGD